MNIEQAKELKQSVLFSEFSKEILGRIESVKSQMENCAFEDLRALQIEIQVYRKVLNIPQDVLDREEG